MVRAIALFELHIETRPFLYKEVDWLVCSPDTLQELLAIFTSKAWSNGIYGLGPT